MQVEGECYLFDCGTPEEFTCVFDHHARFMSGALEVNRHQFEKISRGHQGKWIYFASFTGDNVGSCRHGLFEKRSRQQNVQLNKETLI